MNSFVTHIVSFFLDVWSSNKTSTINCWNASRETKINRGKKTTGSFTILDKFQKDRTQIFVDLDDAFQNIFFSYQW